MINLLYLTTPRNNTARKQAVIVSGEAEVFISYNTAVAATHRGIIYLDPLWDNYSRTTSKYLYQFLGMKKKEILAGLEEGRIEIMENIKYHDWQYYDR